MYEQITSSIAIFSTFEMKFLVPIVGAGDRKTTNRWCKVILYWLITDLNRD